MQYRFGNCRLDMASRQLLCDGVERSITPKAFDLLRLLIEFRPRVLSKAEIMDLVWPDAFVAEANVAILVGDVRAAIGDVAADARLIKTHHGVGYSFSGAVIEQSRSDKVPLGGTRFVLAIGPRRIVLARGPIVIGRDMECDVIISDVSVSRRHACLEVSATQVEIDDLQSKNGTKVDDQLIDGKRVLADGAVVTFGSVVTTLHALAGEGQSTMSL